MKAFWKIPTLLLAILMLALPLASCRGPDLRDEAKTTEGGNSPQTLDEPIVLCNAKESFYRVVRPKTTLAPINDSASLVLSYPADHGASKLILRWSTDEGAPTDAEILIGFTNRPESLEVLNDLGPDDYGIVHKNGKIVVIAHTPERLIEATNYLCENLLTIRTNESGQKEMVYLGDYIFRSTNDKFLFTKDNPLSAYTIVYKKDSAEYAEIAGRLQTAIKEAYNLTLPVVDDSAAEKECEILIGNVNRALAKKHLENNPDFSIFFTVTAVEGKKLLMGAGSLGIIEHMINTFCSTYIKPIYSNNIVISSETLQISKPFTFADTTELAEGANLRVMSFNILCELWNELAGIPGRELPVIAPIFTYKPDILGLQEVSDGWYKALDPLLGPTYAIVDSKTQLYKTNFSPLAYNTETLKLLEHGVLDLKVGGNGLRVVSWGYFERKSDGARFLAMNTHWNVSADAAERTAQSKEMAEFVVTMKAKYNCPVITTGDYNTRASDTQFELYVSTSGLRDACLNAKVANRMIKTTHTLFSESTRGEGEAIDHIFASSEVELLYYNVLIDPCLAPSSDHYPIYADVKLSK